MLLIGVDCDEADYVTLWLLEESYSELVSACASPGVLALVLCAGVRGIRVKEEESSKLRSR